MNWAKLKQQVDKTTLGCGIPPGFGTKLYAEFNSKLYNMYAKLDKFEIDSTSLSLFGEDDVKHMIKVNVPLKEALDVNKTGSVLDHRFGTTAKDVVCGTCCQTNLTCPGHYGYIKLNIQMIHPLYVSYLPHILRAVCQSCGNLIANESSLHGSPQERLEQAESIGVAKRKCPTCSYVNHLITTQTRIKPADYYKDDVKVLDFINNILPVKKATKDDEAVIMSFKELDRILGGITMSAKHALGFGDPDMRAIIMKNVIVCPVSARPGQTLTGVFENSNMSLMYDLILRTNMNIYPGEHNIKDRNYLFMLINRMIDKPTPNVSAIAMFVNVKEQISRKSGVFRSNAMGKRIDFSSRTVLSPASETCVGEMTYPMQAASMISVPTVVNRYNIDQMRDYWNQGKMLAITPMTPSHPQFEQTIFVTKMMRDTYKPYLNDVCHRHVMNGDMIMFNRQPTLNMYALRAVQALIVDRNQRVNGINSCVTKPHNADFDGDEGNVYVLQTMESQVEAKLLTNIRNSIVSSSYGSPIVSIQYHGIVGLFLLTKDNVVLDEEDWYEGFRMFWGNRAAFMVDGLHGHKRLEDVKVEDPKDFFMRLQASGIHPLSGKALFSCLLPHDMYYNRGSIKIRSGILLTGPLTKKDISGGNRNIIHTLVSNRGNERCSDFLSSAQKMSDWYLIMNPITFSVSAISPQNPTNKALANYYQDTTNVSTTIPDNLLAYIHDSFHGSELSIRYESVDNWVREHREVLSVNARAFGLDEPFKYSIEYLVETSSARIEDKVRKLPIRKDMSVLELEARENKILAIASETNKTDRDEGIRLLGPDNPLIVMYTSGAKGSEGNIAQLTTSIGQTSVYGRRPEYIVGRTRKHIHGTRTLIFFEGLEEKGFKETIQSRGYINASFLKGTEPAHYIFSMAHERIGVITSRISTAESGYFTRQLIKFCEDLKVTSTGSIKSAQSRFIACTVMDGIDDEKAIVVDSKKHGRYTSPVDVSMIVNEALTRVVNKRLRAGGRPSSMKASVASSYRSTRPSSSFESALSNADDMLYNDAVGA